MPLILTLLGCGGRSNAPTDAPALTAADWEKTTKIEYRYGDSSVAPDYHRSYLITITDSMKTMVIDSYGDVLLSKQYSNTPTDFQIFKEELSKKGIKKHDETDSGGCCGGTTETLRLYSADAIVFDAYVYHCSGKYGTLFLPDGTADFIRSQIPESVDSLINSTFQND
ncbi:MAG: hypothetical protein J6Z14_05125 [Prevotella sp.]|nr:hypothetical protein [Prevotella sp.]